MLEFLDMTTIIKKNQKPHTAQLVRNPLRGLRFDTTPDGVESKEYSLRKLRSQLQTILRMEIFVLSKNLQK